MRTLLGLILLSIGTFSATFLFFKKDILRKDIESALIEKVWQSDFDRLIEQKQLPASWGQIKEMRIIALSNKAAKWIRNVKVPVYLNPKGHYQLEISMDHNEDSNSIAVITTYNLVDLKSKNTLWEFGRTYTIPNKKWIDWTHKILRYTTYFLPNEEVSASRQDPNAKSEVKAENTEQQLDKVEARKNSSPKKDYSEASSTKATRATTATATLDAETPAKPDTSITK